MLIRSLSRFYFMLILRWNGVEQLFLKLNLIRLYWREWNTKILKKLYLRVFSIVQSKMITFEFERVHGWSNTMNVMYQRYRDLCGRQSPQTPFQHLPFKGSHDRKIFWPKSTEQTWCISIGPKSYGRSLESFQF